MVEQISAAARKYHVQNQSCFSGLADDEAEILASLLNEVTFQKGDIIVTQGDRVDSVYIIVSGSAEVQVSSVKDNKVTTKSVATLGPEKAIGLSETGFYSLTGRRTATVIAKERMVALKLSVAAFNGFALAYHHVNEVMRNFASTVVDKDF